MICPNCEQESDTVGRRRLNTAFVDDELNHEYSCLDCFQEHCAYYKERWEDYWADVIGGLW
jgi:hypothetical protein